MGTCHNSRTHKNCLWATGTVCNADGAKPSLPTLTPKAGWKRAHFRWAEHKILTASNWNNNKNNSVLRRLLNYLILSTTMAPHCPGFSLLPSKKGFVAPVLRCTSEAWGLGSRCWCDVMPLSEQEWSHSTEGRNSLWHSITPTPASVPTHSSTGRSELQWHRKQFSRELHALETLHGMEICQSYKQLFSHNMP